MDRPPAWSFQEGVDGKLKSNLQWPYSMQCQKLEVRVLNLQTRQWWLRERDYAGCHGNEATHARSEDVGHHSAWPR